ncbi:MAG: crossover junction endodeoxyribonuclease RuvC [Patescibacteria group bacterium]
MILLGVDPGSVRVGYGAIAAQGSLLIHLESGLIPVPGATKAERLVALEQSLGALIDRLHPERVGIERLFIGKNRKTANEVAHARGVIIATIARRGVPIVELSPSEVKCAVTGTGTASKGGVARMVALLLRLDGTRQIDDVTDALAVAIATSGNRLTR